MLRSFDQLAAEPGTPLRNQAPNARDVKAWLTQAQAKLNDARIAQVSAPTRMDAAYDAVLFCALAVACAQGWRAGSEKGHHAVVLEGAAQAIGWGELGFDELDTLRDWRSRKYRAGFDIKPDEVNEAIAMATPFLEQVGEWFLSRQAKLLKQAVS